MGTCSDYKTRLVIQISCGKDTSILGVGNEAGMGRAHIILGLNHSLKRISVIIHLKKRQNKFKKKMIDRVQSLKMKWTLFLSRMQRG